MRLEHNAVRGFVRHPGSAHEVVLLLLPYIALHSVLPRNRGPASNSTLAREA